MQIIVNHIQHFSLHDGPGIRTTAFLQGCPLRCAWCHNPETWPNVPPVRYQSDACLHCGACVRVCPSGAQSMDSGFHHYNRERCISCQKCATVCFSGALSAGGRAYTLPELLPVLTRDARLYALSSGGVTFSGGEPLLQSDAVAALCTCLRNEQVHCAVDTALNVPWPAVAQVAACADLFLVDLKLMDSEKHKQYTGYGNKLILDNLQKLSTLQSVIIRVPVVCGVNDDQENAVQTAQFLATKCKSVVQVELLPYHDLGIQKAAQMGIQQQRFATPSSAKMDELTAIYSAHGLSANHQ